LATANVAGYLLCADGSGNGRRQNRAHRDMPATYLPDLNDPAFAPIRARLARLYMEHREALGAAHTSDEVIVQRVDDITTVLMLAIRRALIEKDADFLQRYSWFTDAAMDLLNDVPAKPLDG